MGYKDKKNFISKSGFAITGMLILLPLLVGGLMFFTTLIFSLKNFTLAQKICINHVLSTQNQLEIYIKKLLFLNPQASYLRTKEFALKQKYMSELASLNPFAFLTKAKITAIKIKRKALDLKQKSILIKSKVFLKTQISLFNRRMKKRLGASSITHQHYKAQSLSYPIAVKKSKNQGPAPTYKRTKQFSKDQNISISWNMYLYRGLDNWIKTPTESEKSYHSCSATIKKKNGLTSPHLTQTNNSKNLLKFFL